ncbi:ABC transporter substrate-binding protein [Acidisphaera sp. L21]|uniref:ABC transporter substrate-binding protein n=1 Tax=Acidisphaera sp. L21 TaxID=1641851 RepID=UPI00131B8864|nr:ABC transporter substrate-binding protein [Acidisphaera sp. L21]
MTIFDRQPQRPATQMLRTQFHAPHLGRRLFLAGAATLPAWSARAADPVLRVTSPWEFDSPDPLQTGYVLRRLGIAETLVGVRPNGDLVGLLADRWAVDPDHLTWRFHLRDARFHDGTAVSAGHVAWTLNRVRADAESLSGIPVSELRAEDDRTLLIRTTAPFASLPSYLTDYAGIILSPSSYDAAGRPQRQIATGPYRITRLDGARVIEAEAFPAYWGKQAGISQLRYTAVVLGETRANMAQAGEVDVAFTLLPQAAETINRSGTTRVVRATIPRARMMSMNLRMPQFADLRVRRALSLAIDRPGIATAVLRHPQDAATQLLPPVMAGWHDPTLPSLQRDGPAAKRLLAEAAWTPGADGILAKGGDIMRFNMMVPSNRPEMPLMAQAMQAQFREIGVDIAVKPGPSGSLPGMVRDGSLQTALVSRTYVNVPDPIGTMLPDFASDRPVWSSPGFVDAKLRDMVQRYLAAFDEPTRAVLRFDIVKTLQDQLPVIPVSWTELNASVSSRIAADSFVLDPYEQNYLLQDLRWA